MSHLVEKLTGEAEEDGKPKVFRNTAVKNLSEFQQMNVRGNSELTALVQQAEQILGGVDPNDLRKDLSLKQQIAAQMATVKEQLDGMVQDAPTRLIDLEDE